MADANDKLSNLDPPTAINADLLPGTDNNVDLGSSSKQWKRLYVKQTATDLIPETDNSIELGSATKRWKKLYLRADSGTAIEQYKDGVSPAKVLELDYRGIFRGNFEGVATLTPAALGTPDSVVVTFPGVDDADYHALVIGNGGILVTDLEHEENQYRLYAQWHAPLPAVGVYNNTFTAWVTYHAYNESDNREANMGDDKIGSWNNFDQMRRDLNISATIPAALALVYWKVIWPL